MGRFKPAPGLIGYDFGTKPAFSVTVGQLIGALPQQEGEDEPALYCHDQMGDHLSAAISGVLACTDCYTFDGNDYTISWTGVNGVWDAVWDGGLSQWVVVIGSVTITRYTSSDGTCVGFDIDDTADITLFIGCSGFSLMGALAIAGSGTFGGVQIFQNSTNVPFGDDLTNQWVSGGCGPQGFGNFQGAYDGVLTLSIPP